MLVTGGNVTGIVDQLERAGLIVRTEDPADRRVYLVKLTKEGRRSVRANGRRARIMDRQSVLRHSQTRAAGIERILVAFACATDAENTMKDTLTDYAARHFLWSVHNRNRLDHVESSGKEKSPDLRKLRRAAGSHAQASLRARSESDRDQRCGCQFLFRRRRAGDHRAA